MEKGIRPRPISRPRPPMRPQSPFSSQLPPQARRSKTGQSAGRGVLVVLLLMLCVAGVIAYYGYHANRSTTAAVTGSTKTAHKFLDDLGNGDYKAATTQLSISAKQDITADSLKLTMTQLEKTYGPFTGARFEDAIPRDIAGLETCKISYTLNFERGSVPLHLVAVQGYHGWTIDAATFG